MRTQGHLGIVELLLAKGASANAAAPDGTLPVHLAAWKGHDAVLKLLIINGADFRVSQPRVVPAKRA